MTIESTAPFNTMANHIQPRTWDFLGKFRVVGREGEGFGVALKFPVSRLRYQKLPVVIRCG